METRKKLFVPLFITFLMVVGAFAVMVPAPGANTAVGGQDPIDTRAMTGEPISVFDAYMEEQEALQPEPETAALPAENPAATKISDGEDAPMRSEVSDHIVVTSEVSEGTRSPGVDAGGPYGGPDTYEGTMITFTATVDDPSLIFFRWDFDNDGMYDTPWRLSLTMSDTIDEYYDDDYFGDITVEAWDGVSTQTIIHTGDILDGWNSVQWIIYPATIGWHFRAKADLTITALGYYGYAYYFSTRRLILWDEATQSQMRSCSPSHSYYTWNWCSIAPVTLAAGEYYVMSIYKRTNYYPYLAGTNWGNIDTNNDYITIDEFVYKWYPFGYPGNSGGTQVMPLLDFRFQWIEIIPLTETDTAFLEVNNVAPNVYNVLTNPPMAYEGGATSFTAQFDDPGAGDDWEYRWDFGDGEFSNWFPVKKFDGGASVLILHSITNNIDFFKNGLIPACGPFCITVDDIDWGPLGENRVPDYSELIGYDIIILVTNWGPLQGQTAIGDMLADFQDDKGTAGSGGVIGMWDIFDTNTPWDVRGRWFDDEYSPVKKAFRSFTQVSMGTIYVPGHPILAGVTSMTVRYHQTTSQLNPGATRVVDFTDGNIMVATNENPIVPNGALACALPFFPYSGYIGGDWERVMVNAIRYCSRMDDPVLKTMPITTDPASHVYKDDNPTTTSPSDDVNVRVEVRDDDHQKLKGGYDDIMSEDFTGANYPSWPAGWYASPSYGWRVYSNVYYCDYSACAAQYYFYNYGPSTSTFYGPSVDLSTKPYIQATLGFKYTWYTFSNAARRGYVDVSTDGGITWTNVWYRESPPFVYDRGFQAVIPVDWIGGESDIRLRFRLEATQRYAYYFWGVDDIWIEAAWGTPIWGLGEASGVVTIVNVEPTVHNGPTSGHMTESGIFDFVGYKISDPALWEPTEWFAYKWDFDDGTGSDWIYKGSLAPPELDILIMHSWAGELGPVVSMLESLDLVGSVTTWDFFNTQTAPTLGYMLNYDVLMWASNWAWLAGWWTALKRLMGDAMADYMDLQRGGIVTWMATYDLSPYYGDVFALVGRYMDDDYGAFETKVYPFGAGQLGEIHYPDHPVIKAKYTVETLTSSAIHSGDQDTTDGGLRLASWSDGGAAIGVKELANGMRSVNYGGFGQSSGDIAGLMRNAIAWTYGAFIPTDDIFPMSHQYGDNGVYNVDIALIDDDMGWTWDMGANAPLADMSYPQTMTHYGIPISVDNVDPTLHSMRAYTEMELCIRMTGNKGNMATISLTGSDGTYQSATAVREPGNPAVACLQPAQIDMTPGTQYQLEIFYDPADDDGANPTWTFSAEFPGGKIKEMKFTFDSNDGPTTATVANKDFKQLAIGAPIDFEAFADDPGSDDLAFVWVWGPEGAADPAYDIHIYTHPGVFYTTSTYLDPATLPFMEADFYKALNDQRTPEYDPIRVTDKATHSFDEDMFGAGPTTPWYVYLLVMDDDVDDDYPSLYGHPGVDMDFIVLDW